MRVRRGDEHRLGHDTVHRPWVAHDLRHPNALRCGLPDPLKPGQGGWGGDGNRTKLAKGPRVNTPVRLDRAIKKERHSRINEQELHNG